MDLTVVTKCDDAGIDATFTEQAPIVGLLVDDQGRVQPVGNEVVVIGGPNTAHVTLKKISVTPRAPGEILRMRERLTEPSAARLVSGAGAGSPDASAWARSAHAAAVATIPMSAARRESGMIGRNLWPMDPACQSETSEVPGFVHSMIKKYGAFR